MVVIREAYCRSAKECEREKRMSAWTCVCVCGWENKHEVLPHRAGVRGGSCGMWHVAVVGRAMFTSELIVKLGVCTYVCEVKEGGLEKLADPEGALDTKQRRPWEHNPPFRDGVDADSGGVEVLEPSEEARVGVGEGGHIAKILDVGAGELVALDELEALCEAGEDGELALERVLAEEEVKDARLFVEVRLPVRVAAKG